MIRVVTKSIAVMSLALVASGCIVDTYDNDCYDCGGHHQQPDPTPTPAQYARIGQFATGAAASSEGIPGSLDYSALKALGEPDVFECADHPDSWSPYAAEPNPTGPVIDDWIELTFDEYVWVHEVRIFENYNPGAIVAVDLEAADGLSETLVLYEDWWGNGPAPCPSAFVITVDSNTTYEQYNRVVIYFDSNLVGDGNRNGNWHDDYNEIDAVELIGDIQIN